MFDPTEEIVSQIIFSMENQKRTFLVRLRDGLVIPAERKGEEPGATLSDKYEPPPKWQSSDGYQMMDRFLVTVRNPLVREQLRSILLSGRGVFRQFKDTLQEWPEVQRRWFTFKRAEMRARIFGWYNALREREGLPKIPVELATEEAHELVQSDFSIRPFDEPPAELLQEIDREAFFEAYAELDQPLVDYLYQRRRQATPDYAAPSNSVLAAYTPDEELAGLLWATQAELQDGSLVEQIEQIYVLEEYRGLGIAEALTDYYLTDAGHRGVGRVLAEGPYVSDPVSRLFEQSGASRVYLGSLLDLEEYPFQGESTGGEEYPPDSYL